jgi:hypothetical protein
MGKLDIFSEASDHEVENDDPTSRPFVMIETDPLLARFLTCEHSLSPTFSPSLLSFAL